MCSAHLTNEINADWCSTKWTKAITIINKRNAFQHCTFINWRFFPMSTSVTDYLHFKCRRHVWIYLLQFFWYLWFVCPFSIWWNFRGIVNMFSSVLVYIDLIGKLLFFAFQSNQKQRNHKQPICTIVDFALNVWSMFQKQTKSANRQHRINRLAFPILTDTVLNHKKHESFSLCILHKHCICLQNVISFFFVFTSEWMGGSMLSALFSCCCILKCLSDVHCIVTAF